MLEVNKKYKYKEICENRQEKIKTGKAKQLQLKDWRNFFEWENPTKQIFRVTEVYDQPKEKVINYNIKMHIFSKIKMYSFSNN